MELWDLERDSNMLLVSIFFACHVAFAIIFHLILGWLVYKREKIKFITKHLLNGKTNLEVGFNILINKDIFQFDSKLIIQVKLLESESLPDSDSDGTAEA